MYAVLNLLIFIKNKCAYSCFWQACICIFLVKFDNKTLKYCSKLLWASFSLKNEWFYYKQVNKNSGWAGLVGREEYNKNMFFYLRRESI